jgi:hypothetical protein
LERVGLHAGARLLSSSSLAVTIWCSPIPTRIPHSYRPPLHRLHVSSYRLSIDASFSNKLLFNHSTVNPHHTPTSSTKRRHLYSSPATPKSKVQLRVLPKDQLPECASPGDELIQVMPYIIILEL